MHQAIKEMLSPYQCKTPEQYKNALKEIVQEIALLGLSRQDFFDKAAFYGGTALRIAHKLDRFSEDLDFTLLTPNPNFDLNSYLKGIEDEFVTYGLRLKAEKQIKNIETPVESAFLKANTLELLLSIEGINNASSGTHKNELLKIKLEIDTDPPNPSGETESTFLMLPIPFSFRILTLPSLFAGKLHAVLCRQYKSGRVKGRDFYDFLWYMKKGVKPDLLYLEAKMQQSGHLSQGERLDTTKLKELLNAKFETLNWGQAKRDVTPFINDTFALNLWSTDFFKQLAAKL
ncbi:MAG: nucleotidyl transferase AbiEii/AbiGii toxin family protein [Bdellovibrio sp.]|nr:nucleotidyl transferase AbiEii/AbiGii toxin family protein [Bdellovibrio sp.]